MVYCLDFHAQSGEKGLEASPSSLISLTCQHSYMVVGSGFETRFVLKEDAPEDNLMEEDASLTSDLQTNKGRKP